MFKRRRIHAPSDAQHAGNVALLLQQQEAGVCRPLRTRHRLQETLLGSIRLQASLDAAASQPASARSCSAVVEELVVHGSLVIVLLASGSCPVFDTEAHRCLGLLNAGPHDVIRSVMLCDSNVLAVSCHASDGFAALHCRSVPATFSSFPGRPLPASQPAGAQQQQQQPAYCTAGISICEPVVHPSFVELDNASRRGLLLNAETKQYKVYDLARPSCPLLFCIPADGVAEVRMSSGSLLVISDPSTPAGQHHKRRGGCLPHGKQSGRAGCVSPAGRVLLLEVLSVVNGQVLVRHELPVVSGVGDLQVLELFGEMLLIRQPLQPFRIYNVLSLALQGSSDAEALSQVSSFLHLQPQHLFLTISLHKLTTWDFKARMVCQFDDHDLWYPDATALQAQGPWVISYCRPGNGGHSLLPAKGAVGSINISNVHTGKLLAKIEARQPADEHDDMQQLLLGPARGPDVADAATRASLTGVTTVAYDEGSHAIFTGTLSGGVHIWSAG